MAAPGMVEVIPPILDSTSDPPPIFDGTTRKNKYLMLDDSKGALFSRLYINDMCPYGQRVWIVRNYKGLYDKIKLVPIDLQNRPAWYREKVYPENKVQSLEHNDQAIGESLDLVEYIDSNFEGPALLLPDDPAKQKFAEELISYSDTLIKKIYASFKGDSAEEAAAELITWKLAFISLRMDHSPLVSSVRPKLAAWIEAINKIDAYKTTKCDPERLVTYMKQRYLGEG